MIRECVTEELPEMLHDGVVRIRRPNLGDASAVYRAVDASRSELERWQAWCTPDYSLAHAEAWIMDSAIRWPWGASCPFVVEDVSDGEIVGGCSVNPIGPFDANYNLGYWTRSDRTNRGIARRAARLAARFAFEQLGAERIGILAAQDNVASLKVAAAVGAREEGLLRERFLVAGRRLDAVAFGLLPGELA